MDAPWKIELLGGLRASCGIHRVERFRTQRSALLLAYLAYYLNRPHTREALIELLWPEVEIDAGRHRLRQEIASLRRQFEPPGIPAGSVLQGDRYSLYLNPESVLTDIAALQEQIRRAASASTSAAKADYLREASVLAQKEFLPGFYENWVLAVRRQIAETEIQVLQQLADAQEISGDLPAALVSRKRLVQIDGLREEAHLQLMRLLAATGQSPEALRQFQELRRILKEQAGMEPSAQAFLLARQIEENRPGHISGAIASLPPLPLSERKSEEPQTESAQPNPPTQDEPGRVRLPLRFTRFIGRGTELTLLEAQLREPGRGRVVTLTGPGGSGKTRLSLEAAERVQGAFSGIVAFVSLAEVTDARNLLDAILNALPVSPASSSTEPLDRLTNALNRAPGNSLLILDNFEQLAEKGGAEVIQSLRERVPDLVCLISSRMPLVISGEREIEILPLPVPVGAHTPERLMEFASIALFVDRAQAVSQTFQLTPHNAATVAALCARLEGMPLAIELTAAWARTLTPAQMLARYASERDALLVSRRKDSHPRHRTMEAAIAWSFALLPGSLQRFFTQLAVFRGGWTLEALEVVSAESGAVEHLNRLRQSSLVSSEERDGENRYRMLELLREFADSHLEPADRADVSRRHLDYFLSLLERTVPLLNGPEQNAWMARLDAEHDNIRAALAWALENLPKQAVQLANAAGAYWYARGHFAEGLRWTEEALKRGADAPPKARAGALTVAGTLANELGDLPLAAMRHRESLAGFRELGEELSIANSLFRLGRVLGLQGEYAEAEAALTESLTIAQRLSHDRIAAMAHLNLAIVANFQRDSQRGEREAAASLALHRKLQYPWGISAALGVLAVAVRNQGDLQRGIALCGECLAQCRALGDTQGTARALHSLGNAYLHLENYPTALPFFQDSLRLFEYLSDRWNVALVLSDLALWVAKARGEFTAAARLFGAAEGIWGAMGAPLNKTMRYNREQFVLLLRQTLTEPAVEAALDAGRNLPLDRAVALALGLK